MAQRVASLCAASLCAVGLGAPASPARAQAPAPAADLASLLSSLDRADPNAPEALYGRLAYATRLLDAGGGDCGRRADAAQRQVEIVAAKPAFSVAMPLGPAQAASVEYAVHTTRAGCADDPATKQSEFRAARDAALRAAEHYRDAFDYPSMATLQFNAAVATRRLGDPAAAEAMLRSVLETDETYGLRRDADDNAALLRRWTASSGTADAEPKSPPPARPIHLKFAWSARSADVAVTAAYATVVDGRVVQSQGSAMRTMSLRPDGAGWIMAFPTNLRTYRFNEWLPGEAQQELTTLVLANIRLSSPSVRISGAGEFRSVVDSGRFAAKLAAETAQLVRSIVPDSGGKLNRLPWLDDAVGYASAPDEIESMAAEGFGLTTATWIGAALDQGVWYDMTAPLRAPGTAYVIDHDIQFAYTRRVPCTAASTDASCVEIVLHATPNPAALREWIDALKPDLGQYSGDAVRYWSVADIRIVADPDTLLPYSSDVRRYWYLSAKGAKTNAPVISSERIVSTTTYR